MSDSFKTRAQLNINNQTYHYHDLNKLPASFNISKMPHVLKVVLENLARLEDGRQVTKEDIEAIATQITDNRLQREISFTPSRVLLQDFTGVPAVVDLAAMRDAMKALGGDANKINPLQPVELVIDHSVQVDAFGNQKAFQFNADLEFERNKERYAFLRWGQEAFSNFKVVPPDTGIVHQVNLEYLARVAFVNDSKGEKWVYPDTLVGTDSHTTMINGLGVLGWGVGGIEAEAAMLGQPLSMLIPEVIGFRIIGALKEGTTATDLVLTVTQMLRAKGVVGKFVEFFGKGLSYLPLADRATIGNMAPEYGATCGYFPIDEETLKYLRLSGRSEEHVALVEAYAKAQGLFRHDSDPDPIFADILELDLSQVEPSLAGPKRPQDRVPLQKSKAMFEQALQSYLGDKVDKRGIPTTLQNGAVVIAAITSCTNTSNPAVMLGAGLLARNAVQRGLKVPDWVKTSLAPGSRVVTAYLEDSGLLHYLDTLGFDLVGYGCTTCIGNSGPLPEAVSEVVRGEDLYVCAVLSGNRNFEGRIHPDVRMNYLASPPLVVAYALAGRMDIDLYNEPLGADQDGKPVYLRDIWPTGKEITDMMQTHIHAKMFNKSYSDLFAGDAHWKTLVIPHGDLYQWGDDSNYVRKPPYFEDMKREVPGAKEIHGARVLAKLGDSVTTDHISPAGSFKRDTPAGKYLLSRGVKELDFNSYGSRRGDHEVMMRGTFANVRLRNQLVPGVEGGFTLYMATTSSLLPLAGEGNLSNDGKMSIFDAAMKYKQDNTPLIVLAGKEYGSGSSRDWAAKGPRLLGVLAVIAESYERIHRSNLVGMGILPLEYPASQNADSLGLTGKETFDITGIGDGSSKQVTVVATDDHGKTITFQAKVRIDTPQEVEYYQNGGILQYVLRSLL